MKDYCRSNGLAFIEDGVVEVAADPKSEKTLHQYFEWGIKNGLNESEITILSKREVSTIEPHVRCQAAVFCKKDASVNYGQITQTMGNQIPIKNKRARIITFSKVVDIRIEPSKQSIKVEYFDSLEKTKREIDCSFLINAAGSNSINILNKLRIEHPYQDLLFRGEYWIAPSRYNDLTRHSIYSVPQFQQFPFLDPHWIIRVSGTREVGPNACPVLSPYGYNNFTNAKEFLPKIYGLISKKNHGINRTLFRKELLDLVTKEALSSISKRYMINRVKKFLPSIDPKEFRTRGTAGIRSVLIDKDGSFVSNPVFILRDNILHILNYNSPGATGAIPISYAIIFKLLSEGILKCSQETITAQKVAPFDVNLVNVCKEELDIDIAWQ
ncbi:L-2-hydroxyglutarate oxidase LhgO [Candidatus Nitrosocosmicus franklandus]|uniref:L-2-hydroxyglutarate oxidase LhgO n=1 Tax=Candidatus Nitrosocosmicus franklandianus TaxID=1798806 RepID=A0A484I964_9ARCH|nr:L-2-hydroxyglutarate oxidase LhgO [Candidatus Nitrosocosmicus franklandus]